MLSLIKNNPFRILGVYSDASKVEILANAGKLKAFARVNKPLSFPLDNTELMGNVERTEESIEKALSSIQNESEKIKHALFWFLGTSEEIKDIQSEIITLLSQENYSVAISKAASLYALHGSDILSSLAYENSSLSIEDLREFFLISLTSEIDFSKVTLDKSIIPSDWYTALKGQTEVNLLDQIKDLTADIKNSTSPESKYQLTISFIKENGSKVEETSKNVDPNSPLYPALDNLADEIVSCAVDYQRNSYDYFADKKALLVTQFASKVAQVSNTKQRCKENIDIFKDNQTTLLPEMYANEAQQVRKLKIDYAKSDKTIASGKYFAQSALSILSSIKSKVGASKAYLSCSADVVNDVLTVIIDKVNDAMHASKDELHSTLKEAYEVTKFLSTFDMDEDFKANRFDNNAKTLKIMCLRRGIIKRTFGEMMRAEDSSSWQAALFIHIAVTIAGAIITDNGDVQGGAILGFIAGALIWLSCWRDRSEDEMGDGLWGCLGSFGCLSLILMGGIFVYWIALKSIKFVINKIKENIQ